MDVSDTYGSERTAPQSADTTGGLREVDEDFEEDALLSAVDSLCATVSQEQYDAQLNKYQGRNFPDPVVTQIDALRWPLLPMQWKKGDRLPNNPSNPSWHYDVPDPSKRNEELPVTQRNIFSTPLRDPQGDFARVRAPINALDLERDKSETAPKLPPPEPETAVHLIRKYHRDTMDGWIKQETKRVNNVASRDVLRVLKGAYKLGRKEKAGQAVTAAEEAMAARAELTEAQSDLRATLADAKERKKKADDRARKVAEIGTYCNAMQTEATARREEVLVLNAEAEKLAAEKAKLLAELQAATTEPGPAAWSGKVALAGLDAAASSLREDLKVLEKW